MTPGNADQGGRGNPTELHPNNNDLRGLEAAVRVLEAQRELMAATAEQMRTDVRDARDRVIRMEEAVKNLPTKDWIGGAVNKAVILTATIVGVIVAVCGLILHLVGK